MGVLYHEHCTVHDGWHLPAGFSGTIPDRFLSENPCPDFLETILIAIMIAIDFEKPGSDRKKIFRDRFFPENRDPVYRKKSGIDFVFRR